MHARQVLKADIFNSGKLWFTSLRAIFSVASGGVIFPFKRICSRPCIIKIKTARRYHTNGKFVQRKPKK